jgi:hypothetical protein
MLPQRLLPQVGATEHGGIEHRRLLPMIAAAELFNRTQDLVLPLPLPLPVSVQPAPLSPTTSCECASLPDSPELSPLPEGTYDEWSINAFQRCRQLAAGASSSCSASVLPDPNELVDTEQSYKCKFPNAAVAETTDGKHFARERSEDGLCVDSCRVPSHVICADLSNSSELPCDEIKHCLFDDRFQHRRSSSLYPVASTIEMFWRAIGATN